MPWGENYLSWWVTSEVQRFDDDPKSPMSKTSSCEQTILFNFALIDVHLQRMDRTDCRLAIVLQHDSSSKTPYSMICTKLHAGPQTAEAKRSRCMQGQCSDMRAIDGS